MVFLFSPQGVFTVLFAALFLRRRGRNRFWWWAEKKQALKDHHSFASKKTKKKIKSDIGESYSSAVMSSPRNGDPVGFGCMTMESWHIICFRQTTNMSSRVSLSIHPRQQRLQRQQQQQKIDLPPQKTTSTMIPYREVRSIWEDAGSRQRKALSRPESGFFCLSITASNRSKIYLAASSPEARHAWVNKIQSVCNRLDVSRSSEIQTTQLNASTESSQVEAIQISSRREPPALQSLIPSVEPQPDGSPLQPHDQTSQELVAVDTDPMQPKEKSTASWKIVDEESVYTGLKPEMRNAIRTTIDTFLPLCDEENTPEKWLESPFWGPWWGYMSYATNQLRRWTACHQEFGDPRPPSKATLQLEHWHQTAPAFRDQHSVRQAPPTMQPPYLHWLLCLPTCLANVCSRFSLWCSIGVYYRAVQTGRILMCAFSYPEADHLFPTPSDHVRGDLHVTMLLLRLVDEDRCEATRLLSYNLRGNIHPSLSNTIMQQQATMPRVIANHLVQTEPDPPDVLKNGGTLLTIYWFDISSTILWPTRTDWRGFDEDFDWLVATIRGASFRQNNQMLNPRMQNQLIWQHQKPNKRHPSWSLRWFSFLRSSSFVYFSWQIYPMNRGLYCFWSLLSTLFEHTLEQSWVPSAETNHKSLRWRAVFMWICRAFFDI